MTTTTPNLSLVLYNGTTDQAEYFSTFRAVIAGTSLTSNFYKIDTAYGVQDARITALESAKGAVLVPATFISANYYEATVTEITAYTSGALIILKLDVASAGTVTININSLGTKSVMKINSAGTPVNISAGELQINRYYLFMYDGTRYVWVDSTSGDQIYISGTAGNNVRISSSNTLEDAGVLTTLTQNVIFSGIISPSQITSNQNDYNPTGLSTASILRLDSDTSRTITGLQGGAAGRILMIQNVGTKPIIFSNESASSSAANRFSFYNSIVIDSTQSMFIKYDATTSRWNLISNTGLPSQQISPPQGRLTLTSGVAVTSSDVTGATTLYYTPAVGKYVPCYIGESIIMRSFSELSQATTDTTKSPAAVAASKVYDIFLWDDGGTLRATRGYAWSSDTSRGTGAGTAEIEFVNGFYVNKYDITNGALSNRGILVGCVRSNASSQLVDSEIIRWVSNLYNSVIRKMKVIETTDSWVYTTNTWRQARASTANQLDFLQCVSGGYITATVIASFSNSTGSNFGGIAVGYDSTTTPSDYLNTSNYTPGAGLPSGISTYYGATSTFGRHYMVWLEYGSGSGTTTWYGDAGATLVSQAGIAGWVSN